MNIEQLYKDTFDLSRSKTDVVDVADIRQDVKINARESINADVVADYELSLFEGANEKRMTSKAKKPDPIQPALLRAAPGSNAGYYILDGWHRIAAAEKKGVLEIGVTIYNSNRMYSEQEARLMAATVNAAHGLRRSSADKRKAVTIFLMDDPNRSDALIARLASVSNSLVAVTRQELVEAGTIPAVDNAQQRIAKALDKAKAEGKKPSVRQLAKDAGVSPTTAQKALQNSENNSVTPSDDPIDAKLDELSKKMAGKIDPDQSAPTHCRPVQDDEPLDDIPDDVADEPNDYLDDYSDEPDDHLDDYSEGSSEEDEPQSGTATTTETATTYRQQIDAMRAELTASEMEEIVNDEARQIIGYPLPMFCRDNNLILSRIVAAYNMDERGVNVSLVDLIGRIKDYINNNIRE